MGRTDLIERAGYVIRDGAILHGDTPVATITKDTITFDQATKSRHIIAVRKAAEGWGYKYAISRQGEDFGAYLKKAEAASKSFEVRVVGDDLIISREGRDLAIVSQVSNHWDVYPGVDVYDEEGLADELKRRGYMKSEKKKVSSDEILNRIRSIPGAVVEVEDSETFWVYGQGGGKNPRNAIAVVDTGLNKASVFYHQVGAHDNTVTAVRRVLEGYGMAVDVTKSDVRKDVSADVRRVIMGIDGIRRIEDDGTIIAHTGQGFFGEVPIGNVSGSNVRLSSGPFSVPAFNERIEWEVKMVGGTVSKSVRKRKDAMSILDNEEHLSVSREHGGWMELTHPPTRETIARFNPGQKVAYIHESANPGLKDYAIGVFDADGYSIDITMKADDDDDSPEGKFNRFDKEQKRRTDYKREKARASKGFEGAFVEGLRAQFEYVRQDGDNLFISASDDSEAEVDMRERTIHYTVANPTDKFVEMVERRFPGYRVKSDVSKETDDEWQDRMARGNVGRRGRLNWVTGEWEYEDKSDGKKSYDSAMGSLKATLDSLDNQKKNHRLDKTVVAKGVNPGIFERYLENMRHYRLKPAGGGRFTIVWDPDDENRTVASGDISTGRYNVFAGDDRPMQSELEILFDDSGFTRDASLKSDVSKRGGWVVGDKWMRKTCEICSNRFFVDMEDPYDINRKVCKRCDAAYKSGAAKGFGSASSGSDGAGGYVGECSRCGAAGNKQFPSRDKRGNLLWLCPACAQRTSRPLGL